MGWAYQFAATGRFALEANKIFNTYAEALAFAKTGKTAYIGSVISVINDETDANNGVYYVASIGETGSLKKVGSDTSNFVTKDEIASVYTYKGSKDKYENLPTDGNSVGDVWNVTSAYVSTVDGKTYAEGTNWVWTGSEWDAQGGSINLSAYALKSEVEQAKTELNGSIAQNTGLIQALGASIDGKVDKKEGYNLVSDTDIALIGACSSAIGGLQAADSKLEGRIADLESIVTGDEGVNLNSVNARLDGHDTQIGALESDNTANKNSIVALQAAQQTNESRLTAIEGVNAEQATLLQAIQGDLTTVKGYGESISTLSGLVNKNGADIGTLNTTVNSLKVKNVVSGEKVILLTQDGQLGTDLSFVYDDTTHFIKLMSNETVEVASLDASAFVLDGMLDGATYDHTTKKITLTWNTAAGKQAMPIDLSSLVDTYTAGQGLTLANNQFAVALSSNTNNKLTLSNDGSLLVDISSDIDAINASVDAKINNAFAWIDVTATQA